MNITLFIAVLALFGSIYLWIGKRAAQNQKSNDDYFLMGRNLSFFPLLLTLLATQLGGGTLIGAAQTAFEKGWMVFFYPLGLALGLFVLGTGFGAKLRSQNVSTIAELFEKLYGSVSQRKIASFLSVSAMFFILIGQAIAARMFFVSLGFDSPAVFVLLWTVLIVYTVMGGLKAVVNTDVLQALFILFSLFLVYFTIDTSSIPENIQSNSQNISEIPWTMWLLMPLLFMLIGQDMGQRCFAAKNPRTVSFSASAAAIIFLVASSIAIWIGVMGRKLGISGQNGGVLIETVQALTSPTVSALFMVGIFMAIISTADSLLCSIGSNISFDFLEFINLNEKRKLTISRGVTLFIGILTLALSFYFEDVVQVLMLSYEMTVSVVAVPVAAALFMKRPSKASASLSMLFGALGFILFRMFETPFPKEVLTLMLSLGGYLVGVPITKLQEKGGFTGIWAVSKPKD